MAEESISGIYEIVNLVNGKRYIGSAKDFARRWSAHRRALRLGEHSNRYLQASWDKHGEDAFAFRHVLFCMVPDLIRAEQVLLDGVKPEYNLSPTAGSTLGVRYSEESRRRLSEAMMGKALGRKRSPEAIEKTAAAHRGATRSPETGLKISEKLTGRERDRAAVEAGAAKLRGRKLPPERVAHLYGNTHARGSKHSEEVCAAKAERQRGRPCPKSPEHRAKIAEALRGRKLTPEHKASVSAALRGKKRGPYKKKAAKEPDNGNSPQDRNS